MLFSLFIRNFKKLKKLIMSKFEKIQLALVLICGLYFIGRFMVTILVGV